MRKSREDLQRSVILSTLASLVEWEYLPRANIQRFIDNPREAGLSFQAALQRKLPIWSQEDIQTVKGNSSVDNIARAFENSGAYFRKMKENGELNEVTPAMAFKLMEVLGLGVDWSKVGLDELSPLIFHGSTMSAGLGFTKFLCDGLEKNDDSQFIMPVDLMTEDSIKEFFDDGFDVYCEDPFTGGRTKIDQSLIRLIPASLAGDLRKCSRLVFEGKLYAPLDVRVALTLEDHPTWLPKAWNELNENMFVYFLGTVFRDRTTGWKYVYEMINPIRSSENTSSMADRFFWSGNLQQERALSGDQSTAGMYLACIELR